MSTKGSSSKKVQSQGNNHTKKKKDKASCREPWVPVPLELLRSRQFNNLSPQAAKLFVCLLSQLGMNAKGNGRLDFGHKRRIELGWTSKATATAALRELEEADLLIRTLRGRRGRLALYAITCYPMIAEPKGLEVGPGGWTRDDWTNFNPRAEAPMTENDPAVWAQCRKSKKQEGSPPEGAASPACAPATGRQPAANDPCFPEAGPSKAVFAPNASPVGGCPSRVAICTNGEASAKTTLNALTARPEVTRRCPAPPPPGAAFGTGA